MSDRFTFSYPLVIDNERHKAVDLTDSDMYPGVREDTKYSSKTEEHEPTGQYRVLGFKFKEKDEAITLFNQVCVHIIEWKLKYSK